MAAVKPDLVTDTAEMILKQIYETVQHIDNPDMLRTLAEAFATTAGAVSHSKPPAPRAG